MENANRYSAEEWETKFGKVNCNESSYKAIPAPMCVPDPIKAKKQQGKAVDDKLGYSFSESFQLPQCVSQKDQMRSPASISEDQLEYEARYLLLNNKASDVEIFQSALSFFEANSDYDRYSQAFEPYFILIGHVFDGPRSCNYRIQLFQIDLTERCVLVLTRLAGYAPALNALWHAVSTHLEPFSVISDIKMDNDECEDHSELDNEDFSSDDELFSDEEDDSLALLFSSNNNFLDISSDPTLLEMWAEDIADPNFMEDTILLLSHNCKEEGNMKIMGSEEHAQMLFQAVIHAMDCAMGYLPVVLSAVSFISQLIKKKSEIQVETKTYRTLVSALKTWTCRSEGRETPDAIINNAFIATEISTSLLKFGLNQVEDKDKNDIVGTLAEVQAEICQKKSEKLNQIQANLEQLITRCRFV